MENKELKKVKLYTFVSQTFCLAKNILKDRNDHAKGCSI